MIRFLLLILFIAVSGSAQAGVTVVGNLARHATVKPGETFEGVILLKNTDAQPAEARAFQTDYLSYADGRNLYGEPGTAPRSNAGWITVTPTRVKLEAGETVPVRYKGRAPLDPKLSGTFWSLIMIEPSAASVPTPQGSETKIAYGLQTVIRFGVQIATELGSDATRSLRVMEKKIVKEDGKRSLHLAVENNGERLLIPSVGIELFDHRGASVGRFEGGKTRIYPSCSVCSKVNLGTVAPGKYTAMVLLDSGDDQVMGAQYELAIEP